jgi:hypothetical protein
VGQFTHPPALGADLEGGHEHRSGLICHRLLASEELYRAALDQQLMVFQFLLQ